MGYAFYRMCTLYNIWIHALIKLIYSLCFASEIILPTTTVAPTTSTTTAATTTTTTTTLPSTTRMVTISTGKFDFDVFNYVKRHERIWICYNYTEEIVNISKVD